MVNRIIHFFRLAYQGKQLGKKGPATHLIVVIAFLFTPVLWASLAATINQSREPIEAPEWITIARIILVALTICYLASTFFFERRIRTKSAEKIRKKGRDPELAVLLCGFAIFLWPVLIAFVLFFLGGPVMDVYAYSVFSFIGVGAWSWRQRALFQVSVGDESFIIIRSYTIVLIILGALALVFLGIEILLTARPPEEYISHSHFVLYWIFFFAFLAAGCWIAALLRARRSSYAIVATKAITPILLIWFPFGTVAFVYWIKWVRKKENERINSKS